MFKVRPLTVSGHRPAGTRSDTRVAIVGAALPRRWLCIWRCSRADWAAPVRNRTRRSASRDWFGCYPFWCRWWGSLWIKGERKEASRIVSKMWKGYTHGSRKMRWHWTLRDGWEEFLGGTFNNFHLGTRAAWLDGENILTVGIFRNGVFHRGGWNILPWRVLSWSGKPGRWNL